MRHLEMQRLRCDIADFDVAGVSMARDGLLGRHRPKHSTVADFGVVGLRVQGGGPLSVPWSACLCPAARGWADALLHA